MRAAVITEDRTVRLAELAQRELRPGEARVRVSRCGICGTDVRLPRMEDLAPAGTMPGHEIVGDVIEAAACQRVAVGDRVVVYPNLSCDACPACRRGEHQFCVNGVRGSLGLGTPGGYAESLVLGEAMLERVVHMDDETAAFVEPLAVVVRAASRAPVGPDTGVCILGAGPLGSLLGLYLRALGAGRIVIVHPSAPRRELVQRLGFSVVDDEHASEGVPAALGGQAPEVVFECAGTTSATTLAVDLVAVKGTVVLAGGASVAAPLAPTDLLHKEAWITGSFSCSRADFATALDTLEQDDLGVGALVTATIGLDELPAMLERLSVGGSAQMKVVVTPNGA